MEPVSVLRLNLLRAMFLVIALGNAVFIWPRLLASATELEHMRGVVHALLGALSLLSLLGVRYPLAMLPLMIFELAWKIIWVGLVGLPLWATDRMTPAISESLVECLMGLVLVPLVIPWGYVWRRVAAAPGDPWRARA